MLRKLGDNSGYYVVQGAVHLSKGVPCPSASQAGGESANGRRKHKLAQKPQTHSVGEQGKAIGTTHQTNCGQELLSKLHRTQSFCGTCLVCFSIFNKKTYISVLVGASGKAFRVCKKTTGVVSKTTPKGIC